MTIPTIQPVRYLAISSAYALVVASAGFGAVYAYRVGIEHSMLLAGLSVLMALGLEGVKPLAVAHALKAKSIATGLALGTLALVAVTYSLTSELSLMASSRSDLAANREASSNAVREAVGERQRITDEIRSIGIQRPSAAIQAELNPLLADRRLKQCQGWLANYRLRETCIDKVAPLQAELAKAERREKLETSLSQMADHGRQSVKTADPGSAALVTYLGTLGLSVPVDIVGQWLTLVPVLALELGSAFAVVLVSAVGPSTPQPTVPTQRKREPRRKNQGSKTPEKDATARKIVDRLKSEGGAVTSTERALARALGTSRPTLRRALNGLVLAGMVGLEATRQGTCLRLM